MSFFTFDAPEPEWKRKRRLDHARGIRWQHPISRRATVAEAEAAICAIPPDTRSLTKQLLGDPIPDDPRRPR